MFHRRILDRIEERQQETMAILRTVEAGLIASDPRTSTAAEAYNGLRRQVAAAAQERRRMLLQLVAVREAIERGATVATLREMSGQWIAEAGLRRVDDPSAEPDLFDLVEGEAPPIELVAPAWYDTASDMLVQRGLAKGSAPEPDPPSGEPDGHRPETGSEPPAPESDTDGPGARAGESERDQNDQTTTEERP